MEYDSKTFMNINFIHFPAARPECGVQRFYTIQKQGICQSCVQSQDKLSWIMGINRTQRQKKTKVCYITTQKMLSITLYRKSKYDFLHFTLAYLFLPRHKLRYSYLEGPKVISIFPELHYLSAPNTAPQAIRSNHNTGTASI
jgi:hypothetical protein